MQDRINYLIELWVFHNGKAHADRYPLFHMLHKKREQITVWSECPYDGPFSDGDYKYKQGLMVAPILELDAVVSVQVRCQNCTHMVEVTAKMVRRSYGPLHRLEFDPDTYSKMGGSAHRVLKL